MQDVADDRARYRDPTRDVVPPLGVLALSVFQAVKATLMPIKPICRQVFMFAHTRLPGWLSESSHAQYVEI